MDRHTTHKALIAPLRAAMYDFEASSVREALASVCAPDAVFRLSAPLGDSTGAEAFFETAYQGLLQAWSDLERRDFLVIEGQDDDGAAWVGCAGHYMGTFIAPWLDIPPTGHMTHMRFHEFFRVVNGKVVEFQAIWDIPEVMMQARAWPMVPSLGREGLVPGPATQDGLTVTPADLGQSRASHELVIDMLTHLSRHPSEGGPEVMQAHRFWNPRVNWYGPAGIGTARGLAGFRNWHQIPFLNGLPDRQGGTSGPLSCHFFAEGAYVAATGWPNMQMSVSGDGWLGIAAAGQNITMRSLDFWRVEDGLIRENWVLVDLIDVYAQLGVDVFARLREFNKARNMAPISLPDGMS